MKKIITITMLISLLLALASCAGNSYTLVYYESKELMSDTLSFEMRGVPGLDDVVVYGAMDGELGEIIYNIPESAKGAATLAFRMATAEYADEYESASGGAGITGASVGAPVKEGDRIGSAVVSYYISGSTVYAVWDLGGFSYSAALEFTSDTDALAYEDIYGFVVACIAT